MRLIRTNSEPWPLLGAYRRRWRRTAAVIRALRMLAHKVDTMPRKKHGNIPL
jgi:hypothetical protein